MRHTFSSLILLLTMATSCTVQQEVNKVAESNKSQEFNKVVIDPNLNKEILLGYVNEIGLKNYSAFSNTEINYSSYKVDTELSIIIKDKSKDITVKVVFGSWCGDSKDNVPAFQKIIDTSGFDKSKIEYIAVDRKKKGGSVDVSTLDVKYVPTFIFYRNKKEIGRIIEYPKSETIEQDWVEIVTK